MCPALSQSGLNFISFYSWKRPHLLFCFQRPPVPHCTPPPPPPPCGTPALDPKEEMSHPGHWSLPSTHHLPLQTNTERGNTGTWAREIVATWMASEHPLWTALGSGPASDQRHAGINLSSLGPESGLGSDVSPHPMTDVADVAALLVS